MIRSLTLAAFVLAAPACADEISDTLQSAMDAYADGDLTYALEEIAFAQQLIQEMKAGQLSDLLPEPLDGWTRSVNTDASAAMAIMGGGSAAEGIYEKDGESFTISLAVDSPMIAMFSAMLANPAMMGGSLQRIGREKFIVQDGEMTGLIDNRILVQVSGADVDTMTAQLEAMDFRALSNFGQ